MHLLKVAMSMGFTINQIYTVNNFPAKHCSVDNFAPIEQQRLAPLRAACVCVEIEIEAVSTHEILNRFRSGFT